MGPKGEPDTKTNWSTDRRRKINSTLTQLNPSRYDPCGGGLEYLHPSPESRKRRQKGTPVPGGKLGGYKYGDLALQVGGVSNETVKYGREFCETST
jgi:hypothetical protein